jgi:hypothetical protein
LRDAIAGLKLPNSAGAGFKFYQNIYGFLHGSVSAGLIMANLAGAGLNFQPREVL